MKSRKRKLVDSPKKNTQNGATPGLYLENPDLSVTSERRTETSSPKKRPRLPLSSLSIFSKISGITNKGLGQKQFLSDSKDMNTSGDDMEKTFGDSKLSAFRRWRSSSQESCDGTSELSLLPVFDTLPSPLSISTSGNSDGGSLSSVSMGSSPDVHRNQAEKEHKIDSVRVAATVSLNSLSDAETNKKLGSASPEVPLKLPKFSKELNVLSTLFSRLEVNKPKPSKRDFSDIIQRRANEKMDEVSHSSLSAQLNS